MSVQITDGGGCISIAINGSTFLLNKPQVRSVEVLRNEIIRLDVGAGALNHIHVSYADVTIPANLADVAALRDAIKVMLDTNNSQQLVNAINAQTAQVQNVKSAVDNVAQQIIQHSNDIRAEIASGNQNQDVQMGNMIQTLNEIKTALDGTANYFKEPLRIDDTAPLITYKGYSAIANLPAMASADPVWAIEKIIRNGDMYTYFWANGNQQMTNIWNNRAILNYLPL